MEAQLRNRIKSLVSISNHPIRSIEHKTFKRLLYRNHNQHRHGFYFRKLEHVRRLLSQIDRHVVWESMHHALGDRNDRGSQLKANCPLSISSLTVDDLKSVESLFDKLVTSAIIEAARRVVMDLICRQHFLPFAISVLAILARLFVLERKVLSEVRGVSTEMKLLFATDCTSRPSNANIKDNAPLSNDEDIGLAVYPSEEIERASQKDDQPLELISGPTSYSRYGNTDTNENESSHRESNVPSGKASCEALEPSLYHLIAKHVPETKFVVDVRERISVSLPEVLSTHQRLENTLVSNLVPEARTVEAAAPDRTKPSSSSQTMHEHAYNANPGDNTQQQRLSIGPNDKTLTKAPNDASDSDDIDDIFDALEDSR